MPSLFLVMGGGAVGSGLRYLLGRAATALLGAGFPWGTLLVNLLGTACMGALAGAVARGAAGEPARLLLGVGLLGGFTTFSAFGLETATMLQRGATATAALYVAASVAGGTAALFLGLALARVPA